MQKEHPSTLVMNLSDQVAGLRDLTQSLPQMLLARRDTVPMAIFERLNALIRDMDRLREKIQQRERERKNLEALARIGGVVNSSLEINEVLRIVMDTIIRLTGAERGFLMLRDEQGELRIRIARNWEQESLASNDLTVSRTIIERVLQTGESVLTTNAQEDPRFGGQESVIAYNLRSILCVPLKLKGKITGVIYTDNRIRSGIFTEDERNLLNAFADQAAVAIENARLFESVRRTLAEVTELKNLMDNVFASIASGVITADVEEKIMLCNRAAAAILGAHPESLIGKHMDALQPLARPLRPQIERVLQSDRPLVGLELNPVLPQRGRVYLRLNLSPLKDAEQSTQGVAIVVDDLTEQRRLEAMRRMFERMVSPAVIDQLNPDQLQLGGRRTEITTLFADIRGFTHFSEALEPEALFHVLNRYLAAAAEAVLAEEGTIDKFMGDAVMAFFNAPIPQPDHTLRAVRAALGIRDAIQRLHAELPVEKHLAFGVGIHFGEALLGLIGTEQRLEYTAIGDSVNTAKRIQENSAAKQILISQSAYDLIREHVEVREVEPIHAKGKSQPLRVFEVLGLK